MPSSAGHASVFGDVADQFLRDYPRGARLFAVASTDAQRSAKFADVVAAELRTRGVSASIAAQDDRGEDALRDAVVTPFRGARDDAVLIISGTTSMLAGRTQGLWHYSVWLIDGDEVPHTGATALVDVTDPDAPARRLADYCAVPPSFLT